jgi:hypothetical protein
MVDFLKSKADLMYQSNLYFCRKDLDLELPIIY